MIKIIDNIDKYIYSNVNLSILKMLIKVANSTLYYTLHGKESSEGIAIC